MTYFLTTEEMMSYLSETQIEAMADAAFTSYEFVCCWHAALGAAVQFSIDEFGITPRRSAALYALKLAKLRWHAATLAAKGASS